MATAPSRKYAVDERRRDVEIGEQQVGGVDRGERVVSGVPFVVHPSAAEVRNGYAGRGRVVGVVDQYRVVRVVDADV